MQRFAQIATVTYQGKNESRVLVFPFFRAPLCITVLAIISLLARFTARIRNATHFGVSKLVTDLRLVNLVFVEFDIDYSITKLQQ
jgi:hypothetical protein